MPSPFPGMDPYLEHPARWPGFHAKLISEIQTLLSDALDPAYFVDIELRVYKQSKEDDDRVMTRSRVPDIAIVGERLQSVPLRRRADAEPQPIIVLDPMDVPVREAYLVITEGGSKRVVTVIELLSPTNKTPRTEGRKVYLAKRRMVLGSKTNLVEIDLLRAGRGMVPRPEGDYHIFVSEPGERPNGKLWPVRLDEQLPKVAIPLAPGESTILNMQKAFTTAYDRAHYGSKLDYTKPPVPPLAKAIRGWARKVVAARDSGTKRNR